MEPVSFYELCILYGWPKQGLSPVKAQLATRLSANSRFGRIKARKTLQSLITVHK